MSKIPSIAFIPSGYKDGTVYSVLPTDGSGDLDFSRSTFATRENKEGLIETMGVNVPRLNYKDGGCPSLLLEPSSTNLINYSQNFTQWTIHRTTLSSNVITSPKGDLSGSLVVPNTVIGGHQLEKNISSSPSGTYSIYVKANGYSKIRLNPGQSGNGYANFDTVTESVTDSGGTFFENAKITKEKDGWYRCQLTLGSGVSGGGLYVYIMNELNEISYAGDGVKGMYIFGAQIEELAVATSYIKNDGNASGETRAQDQASKSGLSDKIDSKHGVLFLHAKCIDIDENQFYGLKSSTENSQIYIYGGAGGGGAVWQSNVRVDGVDYYFSGASVDKTIESKIAVVWSTSEATFYINGIKGTTQILTSGFDVGVLDQFGFSLSSKFFGEVSDARVYKGIMTEAEAIELTTI